MQQDRNGTRFRIREKQLTSKQTQDEHAYAAQLRREFADHPSAGLTPGKLAAILRTAEHGNLIDQCWLAEDIEEKDGHIAAELFKRKMAMSTVPFTIEPPNNPSSAEKADAASINDMLRDIEDWEDLLFNMADGVNKGFSNIEFTWQRQLGFRVPVGFEHRPSSWFQLDQFDQDIIRLRSNTGLGEPLRDFNWIQHRHPAKSGYVARVGLVRQLAWPFLFKNYSVRDLAEFLEIYGIPIRVGKYPSGATEPEKTSLLNAVLSVGHNGAGIIPKGMELDFYEAAKGGGEPFMTMISWCERIQSKVILGQTLSAEVGQGGSQALGKIHDGIRLDIRDHDLRQVAGTLNRDLILPMYMLNGKSFNGDLRRKPRLVFDTTESEDLRSLAYPLRAFVGMGMKIPTNWLHQQTKIPQAKDGESVLEIVDAEPMPGGAQLKGLAVLKGNATTQFADQQALEDALDALSTGQFDEQMLGILKPVFAAADKGPEVLKAELDKLWPDMDDSVLTQRLAQVLFVGELWGQLNANS